MKRKSMCIKKVVAKISLVTLLIPEIIKGMKNISEKCLVNCLFPNVHLAAPHRTVILMLYSIGYGYTFIIFNDHYVTTS